MEESLKQLICKDQLFFCLSFIALSIIQPLLVHPRNTVMLF